MKKVLILSSLVLLFASCSPKIPIHILEVCNERLKVCNADTHKTVCGGDSSSCVEEMLSDDWNAKRDFIRLTNICDNEYSDCLNRKP